MIYLDYNSTTPVANEVLQKMLPYFSSQFANAASAHKMGWQMEQTVDQARLQILKNLGANTDGQIVFTSGTTESNHLAIFGLIQNFQSPQHIISQVTEHKCILEVLQSLKKQGHAISLLPVDSKGRVNPQDLKTVLKNDTALVSIMHANNETGSIQNIKELSQIVHTNSKAVFHCDMAQSIGKIAVDLTDLNVDLASFSAHKFYGPKGIGALFVKNQSLFKKLRPLLLGGGQEFGLRSGTLNIPGIVGLQTAIKEAVTHLNEYQTHCENLKIQFIQNIQNEIPDVEIYHPTQNCLPNTINLGFPFIKADDLILALPNLAISTGAACSSQSTEPSYVIQAMGYTPKQAASSIRVSLGKDTTLEEIHAASDSIIQIIQKLRQNSLEYQMHLENK